MAKNKFDKAGSNKTIGAVVQASNQGANVITLKMISDENLFDHPKNNEDITMTDDIEKSIDEMGFTDPLEITDFDFGLGEGNYTILSGHRRRMAGRKRNIKMFPCIVRHFKTAKEVHNYVLLSNNQRDSAKDPLLFCTRYKMHEEYLKENGFKGSFREEIASRLGISTQQADRYNQFNKIILPIWDMVRGDVVGMSSVLPMASHNIEEQEKILEIFNEAIENKEKLTREMCGKIIKGYREGKNTYLEIVQIDFEEAESEALKEDIGNEKAGVSVISVNPEPTESKEDVENPLSRNNEVKYDTSHREGLYSEREKTYEDEKPTKDDYNTIEKIVENLKNEEEREKEKLLKAGEKVEQMLVKLEDVLEGFYGFADEAKAESVMNTMYTIIKVLLGEIDRIADDYGRDMKKDEIVKGLVMEAKSYQEA